MKREGFIDCQLITAFVDLAKGAAGLGGNRCRLIMLDRKPTEVLPSWSDTTTCVSWLQTSDIPAAVVLQCYSPGGQVIQCCGHGLMAASHAWMGRLGQQALTLFMQDSRVESWQSGGETWLRFSALEMQACEVPVWVRDVLSVPSNPVSAACSGGSSGYMVLQWPDGFDLRSLTPPNETLANYTQRALICTAARPEVADGAIELRYFAPQYGVMEDAATGSAMRVLAAYWSSRFDRLRGRQCSASGGRLRSRWAPNYVEVGGVCVTTKAVTLNGE